MELRNYHTHTWRCKHAIGTDEEYVLAAIEAGFKVLGFSDHAPYRDYPSERSHMDWEQLEEYISSINNLKKKYEGIIEIYLGMESEYYDQVADERKELRDMLDYMILGQHFSDPSGMNVSYFRNNTDEELMDYGISVCKAMDSGLFTYLAHPDVFMNRQEEFNETCEKVAHMIAQKAAWLDMPLEVNVHSMVRGKKPFPTGERYYYPNKDFWKIAAQYPVRCIIGIDAHDPKALLETQYIDMAREELKDLDLTFINDPFKK